MRKLLFLFVLSPFNIFKGLTRSFAAGVNIKHPHHDL